MSYQAKGFEFVGKFGARWNEGSLVAVGNGGIYVGLAIVEKQRVCRVGSCDVSRIVENLDIGIGAFGLVGEREAVEIVGGRQSLLGKL